MRSRRDLYPIPIGIPKGLGLGIADFRDRSESRPGPTLILCDSFLDQSLMNILVANAEMELTLRKSDDGSQGYDYDLLLCMGR